VIDCLAGKTNFVLTTRCWCHGLSLSRRQRPTRGSKVLHSQPDDVTRGLKDRARRTRRDVKKATRGQNLGHDARGDAQLSLQPSTTHNQARSHNGTCLTWPVLLTIRHRDYRLVRGCWTVQLSLRFIRHNNGINTTYLLLVCKLIVLLVQLVVVSCNQIGARSAEPRSAEHQNWPVWWCFTHLTRLNQQLNQ
jgi:hypothetical protein